MHAPKLSSCDETSRDAASCEVNVLTSTQLVIIVTSV